MASFQFNFSGDVNHSRLSEQTGKNEKKEKINWLESVEVVPRSHIKDLDGISPHAQMFVCGEIEIFHVAAKEALLRIGDNGHKNAVEKAEEELSDLVAGQYEGGLKIWECTYDLIEYLVHSSHLIFNNLKVLDLGCGAGILGIYTFLNGANVTFQDYNKEVLECVTIPNVLLNVDDDEEEELKFVKSKCNFYSGDWASFSNKLPNPVMFDLIVTSETIYNPENYDKLIDLFLQRLTKDGIIFVAAKTCYFGVGGGTRQFEKVIEKNSLLKSEVCWKSSGGIQREIIKITRNQDLFLID